MIVEFLKLNTRKTFCKVRFAKIITCEKISKSQKFAIFPPLEDPEIWFKQDESWSSKYINYSSTIVFLRLSFFDLQFCDISPLSLDFTSFFSCCFFAAAILPLLVSLHLLMKGKSQRFLRSWVRYRVYLSTFHIEFKAGIWQHFHSSLPSPHTELQAHFEPSQPTTTGCKPWTKKKNRDLGKLVPANLLVNDHSQKLVPAKCNFFQAAKLNTREN